MILYPAIDLKDGKCVRLRQGKMDSSTIFAEDAAAQAADFANSGCEWLHIVDLNGAFAGEPINLHSVHAIRKTVDINIQLGGGIRNLDTIAMWLATGIQRVVLGTVALNKPEIVKQACREFEGHIAVGIDTKQQMVAVEGWAKNSQITAVELAKRFEDSGVCAIIHTDIARDGEMKGPNIAESVKLAQEIDIPVIVSGGVSSFVDLERIKAKQEYGIEGVIIGRALYEGMDIKAALDILES